MVSIISEKRKLENGECSSPKYKRRKVSAIRLFPPMCGPNAAQLNMQKNEVEGDGQKVGEPSKDVEPGGEREGALHDVKGKESSEKIDESKNVEHGIGEFPKLLVVKGSNGISKVLTIEDPKSSQDLGKMEVESMEKHEIPDKSKELMEVSVKSPIALKDTIVPCPKEADNDIQSEVVVEGTTLKVNLLPHHPIPSTIVWKERKYPPRRRVSAVRDFPHGCGRNVQQLSEREDEHLGRDKTDANTHKEAAIVNQVGVVCGKTGDKLEGQLEYDKDACSQVIMQVCQFAKSLEIKGQEENNEVTDDEQNERLSEEREYNEKDEEDIGGSGDRVNKEFIVYTKDKHKEKKSIGGVSSNHVELQEKSVGVQNKENMVVVQGLMSIANCPWRQGKPTTTTTYPMESHQGGVWRRGKETIKSRPSTSNVKRSQRKKNNNARQYQQKHSLDKSTKNTENLEERSKMIIPYLKETETKEVSGNGADHEGEESSENEEVSDDFMLVPRRPIDVTLLPLGVGERGVRSKVREILRLFQAVVRKLLQGEETKTKDGIKLKDQDNATKRIDLRAAKILKAHGKCVNTGKKGTLGPIPGVEVGDFFHYRMELSIIGLHRPPQGGIDYLKKGDRIVATSIVAMASGGYANDVDSSDVLIYTGQGGTKSGDKQAEDQKLERGNLALKNSIDEKNVVRVIRGFKETKPSETGDTTSRAKIIATYTYDGLYTVEKYWQDIGPHGKLVYKFELRRLPGQAELAWKEVKRSKKFKVREGRCVDDISGGKERFPICAVNTVDDEPAPEFTYITSMMYPDWCQPIPLRGCDCKDGCSDSEHCACAVKNGGEIPYNYNGAIVEAKPLVYECGPSCKCPPTCYNRVSQSGIKFPLEIFKTESRGWGVRSLSSIPSGSFICEYLGELLDDKEAEQRAGSDEYLFDIGQNFNDSTLWDGLSALMPDVTSSSGDVVENVGFTIDAAKYGNIGRFINHSCTPNLYAQNVLYDHADKRIPHIMLFAAENIPPLQELTYHYNYTMDEVFDSDGNIKKKNCYCGSPECTGRMY